MALTLFAYQADFRRYKAEIAATYNGVTLTTPSFVAGTDDATPEFLALNPLGKVPLLQTPDVRRLAPRERGAHASARVVGALASACVCSAFHTSRR